MNVSLPRRSRTDVSASSFSRRSDSSFSSSAPSRRAPDQAKSVVLAKPQVLDLTATSAGTGVYYTLPIVIGGNTFHVQIDTGSSDLWLTGSSCTSDPCKNVPRYDPLTSNTAVDTNNEFSIQYVIGAVSGEIYWETMQVGSTRIERQAFASASYVADQDMAGGGYSGVLGLALPGQSIIANTISEDNLGPLSNLEFPPTIQSAPTQAGIFGRSTTPFFSLSLSRPGDPRTSPQLGINSHLQSCDYDCQNALNYAAIVPSYGGEPWFWRVPVQGIEVVNLVDGTVGRISMGSSALKGQAWPIALVDSGAMGIYLADRQVLNAIYGSVGIGPAMDGNYYLPCTTAIQLKLTLTSGSYAIHPLDASDFMSSDPQHKTCLGSIQHVSAAGLSDKGDIILGAAFLRSVYMVGSGPTLTTRGSWSTPQVALLSLTNTSQALDEFNRVRIDHLPITSSSDTSSTAPSGGSNQTNDPTAAKDKHIGAGAIGGIATAALLLSVLVVFLGRYLILRRRLRRDGGLNGKSLGNEKPDYDVIAPHSSGSSGFPTAPTLDFSAERHRIQMARHNTSSSISSSTIGAYSDDGADDGGKYGWSSRDNLTKIESRTSSHGKGKSKMSRASSLLGAGFDGISDGQGLAGYSAPSRSVEDDESSPTSALPTNTASSWRISQQPGEVESARGGGSGSRDSRRLSGVLGGAGSKTLAMDSILQAKREARRSRSESPSGEIAEGRAKRVISTANTNTTVSSSANLHDQPNTAPTSSSQNRDTRLSNSLASHTAHTYPPSSLAPSSLAPSSGRPNSNNRSFISSSSTPSAPSPLHIATSLPHLQPRRPSYLLTSFPSAFASDTIVESPLTSPTSADPPSKLPSSPPTQSIPGDALPRLSSDSSSISFPIDRISPLDRISRQGLALSASSISNPPIPPPQPSSESPNSPSRNAPPARIELPRRSFSSTSGLTRLLAESPSDLLDSPPIWNVEDPLLTSPDRPSGRPDKLSS